MDRPQVMESEMSEMSEPEEGSLSPSAPLRRSSQHTALRSRSPPRYDAVLAQDPQAREAASMVNRRRGFTESMAHAGKHECNKKGFVFQLPPHHLRSISG